MPVSSMISRPMFSVTGTGGRDEPMGLPRTSRCGFAVIGWGGASESSCAVRVLLNADVAGAFTDAARCRV